MNTLRKTKNFHRKIGNIVYLRDLRLSDAGKAFFAGAGATTIFLFWMIITTCLQFRHF